MDSKHKKSRHTTVWTVSDQGFTGNNLAGESSGEAGRAGLREAADLLAAGKLVAFPTETVYGLGADARSTEAVEGVFAAKGRPSDNPLIVHIADRAELEKFVLDVSDADRKLMDAFWPGPLTLVLPVIPGALSPRVTAGLDTVAVRMPDHGIALALIRASGCPLAAPSANRSGRPSPTLASHVREDLDGRIDGIVDGGPAGVGVESTVVRTNAAGGATVLRPGGISAEEIGRVLGAPVRAVSADHSADIDPAAASEGSSSGAQGGEGAGGQETEGGEAMRGASSADEAPRSPGMKYTHYAPSGRLEVVLGAEEPAAETIRGLLAAARERGEKTGVLAFDEHLESYRDLADIALPLGSRRDLREAAARLYAALRRFDEEGATYMVAEGCGDEGIGSAVMNRMGKAAGGRIHRV
ncbi:L-threonylcarbamoyladenylate synthase [Saccharibacillus alkalitolerans]|uniref:Threonylcarbamoyl-AMP synthase n=1 Tax=Saccharibacillus alkalitolerans TaxID=2705290 RepID=A0ABX0F9M0_9BACL|nr:L-threonylcarbamoyladenylate synthase [Saccharibacillus alkalitolerans]NGZ76169.1 threonylcarbamoyl-AMP synthase [Saccharibacillus alkalitolerans]